VETITATDELALYPIHEEDTVVQGPVHDRECRYLAGALQAHRPDLWVVHDVCLYWELGNTERYRAPDVSVIVCPPPQNPPKVYLAWSHPPLRFVAEVASDETRGVDTTEKFTDYEQLLRAPEYLFADPQRSELKLWRLAGGAYQPVAADHLGRIYSVTLEVAFGYDATGFLRIYTPGGEMLLTHEEERYQREEEARQRMEAERRAQAESERAEAEALRRADLERRLAELAAELERLRGGNGQPA
jgi:Uma2 family endonuclease